jgi:hypothetical protein
MNPGPLLLVSLLSLFLAAMVMFWYCLWTQKREATPSTEGCFALQEGQTILGVMDKTALLCFCIGELEKHVHDEEDTVK